MLLLLAASLLRQENIVRDTYGVPHVRAKDATSAWRAMGFSVAQDRMWQLETSRRVSRGTMAEAFGPRFVQSDRETLQTGYTDAELQKQLDGLAPSSQAAFKAYADGVNDFLKAGPLPPEYAENKLTPEPWTTLDSAAIAVKLLRTFGRGGAGEVRNLALITYLKNRKETNGKVLDIVDDLAWREDPQAPTTLKGFPAPQVFPAVTRAETEKHLASLPDFGLIELLGGIRLAEKKESTRVAELVNAPFKSGSYAVLVPARESKTGRPLLVNGPQMGMRAPSVVHECSVSFPGFSATGIDVPGVPGIVVGHTKRIAWGLTSGVADTDDIVVDTKPVIVSRDSAFIAAKMSYATSVARMRTADGPIIMQSAKGALVRRSAHWMLELKTYDSLAGLWTARNVKDADKSIATATMSFNVFMADADGHTAYRYAGRVPIRAPGFDARLPLPAGPEAAWRGFVPSDKMPHAYDPPTTTNWNDKPVPGWTNGDTPVWGRGFRGGELRRSLPKGKLAIKDLEKAIWTIARRDETFPLFGQYFPGFDGWLLDGSVPAARYRAFVDRLREELFTTTVGNLVSPDNFKLALQPDLMSAALEGRTKFDYLVGRKASDVAAAALAKVPESLGAYLSGQVPNPGGTPVPYSNRGTFIELVELLKSGPSGRSNLPPGNAEHGPHSADQAELARTWTYKPMGF
jgi:penicillin amidase